MTAPPVPAPAEPEKPGGPAKAPATGPAPAPRPPSPWRRRLVVGILALVSVGLVVAYFLAVRPTAEGWQLRVEREIQGLVASDLEQERRVLSDDFRSYRRQNEFTVVLLLGAFFAGLGAVLVQAVWGPIEARRGAKLGKP